LHHKLHVFPSGKRFEDDEEVITEVKRFEDDEEVITEVKRWLRQRPVERYREGTQAVASRCRKAKDLEGDCCKVGLGSQRLL
jgi:hypothetical protein